MDTWHILEQRFHDIGNRDHNVVLVFHSDNSGECSYSLSGPVKEGESRGTIVGGLPDEPKDQQDFSTSHYSVGELWDTLHRAGRLLNRQEQQLQRHDHAGAKRFVAMLLKEHGSLAHEEGRRKFFANAARVCGMMAGKLATLPKESQNKTGEISDDDRSGIQDAIDAYRTAFSGADPTSEAIRKRSGLGTNKISLIMAERRAAGLWAVPVRGPSKKK